MIEKAYEFNHIVEREMGLEPTAFCLEGRFTLISPMIPHAALCRFLPPYRENERMANKCFPVRTVA